MNFLLAFLCAEQMDAEDLDRKLLLTPSGDPRRTPENQTVGPVAASRKMLTLQALSSFLNTSTARRSCLGRGEAFGCPPAVRAPERPRPFTHYRFSAGNLGRLTGHVVGIWGEFFGPTK